MRSVLLLRLCKLEQYPYPGLSAGECSILEQTDGKRVFAAKTPQDSLIRREHILISQMR